MAFLSACKNSIVAVTCFGVLILLERPIAYGQTTANKIDQLTQQWLSTERQTANLKATWLTEKPLLTQRIELLRQEKNQINTLLKENKNSTSEAEEKRELLQQQQAKLEREQVLTINAINQLKAQLDSLLSRLPPPLQSTWQNEPSENNAVLLEQQLTRLSKLKAFNDRITIHTMRLTNNTDEEILVKQLYLGVSQAWFQQCQWTICRIWAR